MPQTPQNLKDSINNIVPSQILIEQADSQTTRTPSKSARGRQQSERHLKLNSYRNELMIDTKITSIKKLQEHESPSSALFKQQSPGLQKSPTKLSVVSK